MDDKGVVRRQKEKGVVCIAGLRSKLSIRSEVDCQDYFEQHRKNTILIISKVMAKVMAK